LPCKTGNKKSLQPVTSVTVYTEIHLGANNTTKNSVTAWSKSDSGDDYGCLHFLFRPKFSPSRGVCFSLSLNFAFSD